MKILLCYDGSADADKALHYLERLVKQDDYVVLFGATEASSSRMKELRIKKEDRPSNSDDREREIRRTLYNLMQQAVTSLRTAGAKNTKLVLVETSDVRKTALDLAHQEDVDMIVVGSRGKASGTEKLKRFFVGSSAQYIVSHSPVPVLVVRGDVPIEIDEKSSSSGEVVWYKVSEDNFNLVYDENQPASFAPSIDRSGTEVSRTSYVPQSSSQPSLPLSGAAGIDRSNNDAVRAYDTTGLPASSSHDFEKKSDRLDADRIPTIGHEQVVYDERELQKKRHDKDTSKEHDVKVRETKTIEKTSEPTSTTGARLFEVEKEHH